MRKLGKVAVIPTVASGLIAGGVTAYGAVANGPAHHAATGMKADLTASSSGQASPTPTVTPAVPCSTITSIPRATGIFPHAGGGTAIGQAAAGDAATCHSFLEIGNPANPNVWYSITDNANGVTGWVPGTPWGEN